jgi:simple sugar transport system permease protein
MTFIGLGALVSFRAKIFNIGIFAQMVAGGLFGYLFAALVLWPGRIGVMFSILIPVATGIFIALLIAFLKNRYNINIVVSSIMLN